VLDIAGEKYEKVLVDLDNKSEEFKKASPNGFIPVFVEEGNETPLVESASILRYIADKHSISEQGNYLYPYKPEGRYRVDMIMDFNGTTLRPKLVGAIKALVLGPMMRGTPVPNEETKEQLMNAAFDALAKLQAFIKPKEGFLSANHLTIADI
jgi:glutathione S-transferase